MVSIIAARAASHGRHEPSSNAMLCTASLLFGLLVSNVILGCSESSKDLPGAAVSGASGNPSEQTGSAGTAGGSPAEVTSAGGTSGGSGGSGPTAEPYIEFDFADDVAGWVFAFADPENLIAPAGDAGAAQPAPEGVATATHDAIGDPTGNAGSIRLELPFSGPAQKVSFEVNVATDAMGINLSGRSLSARISVVAGYSMDPMNPPGLKLYVKTGEVSLYADSGYINIAPGVDWQTFTWANVSNPVYVDPTGTHAPTDVRQLGIEFDTGSLGAYSAATLLLDTVAAR
jgi:hypothetical protein